MTGIGDFGGGGGLFFGSGGNGLHFVGHAVALFVDAGYLVGNMVRIITSLADGSGHVVCFFIDFRNQLVDVFEYFPQVVHGFCAFADHIAALLHGDYGTVGIFLNTGYQLGNFFGGFAGLFG